MEIAEMAMYNRMGSGEYVDGESQDDNEESTCGSAFGVDTDEENRMLSDGIDGEDESGGEDESDGSDRRDGRGESDESDNMEE